MKGRFIWRVLFALVVLTVFALGSVAIYRMGFTHGAMTTITIPEGSESLVMPYAHRPMGWHYGPRVGLLGLFPLLCFGGFFFMLLLGGFGCMARRRAWRRYGPGTPPEHWKHHGPWGPGCPPWEQEHSKAEAETPSAETDQTEG